MNADRRQAELARPRKFVWPPRPLDDRSPDAPLPSPRTRPTIEYPELELGEGRWASLRRAWRQVEGAWLGFAAAPLAERAREAGWSPDGPDAYCPRCGASVGSNEVAPSMVANRPAGDCPSCRRRNLPWERMVRLGEHAGLLRDLVHETKFTAWRQLGFQLGRLLGRSLGAALDEAGIDRDRAVLVAMPTTYARRMGRGIDHARVIARGVREVTGLPIVHALDRSHRRSQVTVPVSKRAANVAGSNWPVPGVNLCGHTVVVVDDVRTTGATMATACRVILEGSRNSPQGAGESASDRVRVWGAVVAVAPEPGRRVKGGREIASEALDSA